jgi:hypothetical protein
MITDGMKLQSYRDAQTWAANMGLDSDEQIERVAAWIWGAKPEYGCTWAEFQEANADVLDSDEFWEIAEPGSTG